MRTYYNEWDEPTAAWLGELCRSGHLPSGRIDTRSIRDVRADDVRDFGQCHWFAGIGGWPAALRLAGYGDFPCWTGSPPCQPFSVAGRQRAQSDERHLAPVWLDLVRQRLPPAIFGEQVADAVKHGWLDDLFDALEGNGYACGAAVLPACSVGAPHIRKRLFFGAVRLDDTNSVGWGWGKRTSPRGFPDRAHAGREQGIYAAPGSGEVVGGLADANQRQRRWIADGEGCQPDWSTPGRDESDCLAEPHCQSGRVSDTSGQGLEVGKRIRRVPGQAPGASAWEDASDGGDDDAAKRHGADPHHCFWSGADWIGCRDGKFRPVEPGILPLADGVSGRVGLLRGAGNAILPQAAAVFIQEFLGAFAEIEI